MHEGVRVVYVCSDPRMTMEPLATCVRLRRGMCHTVIIALLSDV